MKGTTRDISALRETGTYSPRAVVVADVRFTIPKSGAGKSGAGTSRSAVNRRLTKAWPEITRTVEENTRRLTGRTRA